MSYTKPPEPEVHRLSSTKRFCAECGITKLRGLFAENSVVCKECVKRRLKLESVVISPEDHYTNAFKNRLSELRRTSEPQIANGVQEAMEILGCTPQEIAATCVKAMLNPGKGRKDLSEEQIKSIPVDYKTVQGFLKMLQEAQIIHDKQLEGNNPFEGVDAEELRAVVLNGTIDQAQHDKELRLQLIRAFAARCSTFFDEVMEIAQELAAKDQNPETKATEASDVPVEPIGHLEEGEVI